MSPGPWEFSPWDPGRAAGGPGGVLASGRLPLYLSGEVRMEDGSRPPSEVRVELVCSGEIQPQDVTRKDGSFNFRVGGNRSLEIVSSTSDRSQPFEPVRGSGVNLSNCELRAALGGYRSSRVQMGWRSIFENSNVGTIVLYPLTSAIRPQLDRLDSVAALRHYQEGWRELSKEEPDPVSASAELNKAIEEDPGFAAAWNLLSEARIRMKELDGAREALKMAAELDPGYVTPRVTLALLELKTGRAWEAAAASEQAVRISPDLAEAHYYYGIANVNLGNLEKARDSLETVLTSPEAEHFPRTHYLLGSISAQSGETDKAVLYYRQYLDLEPDSRAAEVVRQQLEQWADQGGI